MTKRQKLALEASEKRQRLNELLALDELTDEQRSEMDTLTKRMGQIEVETRAAITAEAAEEAEARGLFGNNGDGEPAETRRLLDTVTLADYLGPAAGGGGIEGRAAELNGALKVPLQGKGGGVAVPWDVLATPELRQAPAGEVERRAFTTTTQNDGPQMQRPILQRLFGPGVMDALGVRMDTVPVGRTEWPLISGGAAPAQAKEGTAAAAAVAATFTFANLKAKRLTGVYEYTHEEAASVADIEQALRRDLADAVRSAMSNLIINGATPDGTNPERVQGFLNAISAPADAGSTAVYGDYAGAHASGIDGIHAEMETEVSSVIGTDVYQHAATVYQTGSGESGSEALRRRSRSCRASTYIPDASSGQSKGNLFHLAGMNGGGIMRGDSVAAVWPTLEVIRDIYTKASQGVVLTWVALWDAKVAFRSRAYYRTAFKIT
ncbi:MAG: phage major capsid protein [Candidatus Tectomicrobia bacterium]|nr:phage major capsid protein [Candidatus Tectomicrobia bacterium]